MGLISNAIDKLKGFYNKLKTQYKYDFLKEAETAFDKSPNKPTEALRWLREIQKTNEFEYGRKVPKGGRLYWFKYQDPLHKETLPYWDAEPLVIMSSSFTVKNGETRVLGLNLHLLPPLIRVRVFADIWETHKSEFKKGLTDKEKQPTFMFSWKQLESKIGVYGGDFAIRMYAPSQIKSAIEFATEDWAKAVHIPSRRYIGTNLIQLEKEFTEHLKKKRKS